MTEHDPTSATAPFCADCPDHEACATGWPCSKVLPRESQTPASIDDRSVAAAGQDATSPDISHLLRQRLLDSILGEGIPQEEAEALTDELVAEARKRGAAAREDRLQRDADGCGR